MSSKFLYRGLPFCFALLLMALFSNSQSAPSNDNCSGAIELTPSSGSGCLNIYNGTVGYATQSIPSCIITGYEAREVWYKFTATTTTHRITVASPSSNIVFQLFGGNCGSLTAVTCANTGSLFEPDVALVTNLTIGATYYIRVYDYFANLNVAFSICINSATVLVDNDDCSGSLNVVPSPNENFGAPVTANNYGATQSVPGCAGSAEDDVWFKFTAVNARQKIRITTERMIDPVLEVFGGTCGALNSLVCRSRNSSYSYIDADLTNLVPGTMYYYRVYGRASNNVRTNITTTIFTPPAPPVNDECIGAISLDVNAGISCSSVYSGNTGYPTQSSPSCVASGYDANDVWFKFTATATAHRITLTPISYDNYVFQVYAGSCGNLTSIACVNTGSSTEPDIAVLNSLVVGATYYIRLYDYFGGGSVFRQFSLCVNTTAAPVDNDDCTGAFTVTPSSDPVSGNSVTANNTGATQSLASCYGTAEDDVWFKFTATATRHKIWVSTENSINPVMEIFNGFCGALSSMACRYTPNAGSSGYIDADITNLVPGTTYYYRVYGSAANNIRTNITTRITSPPPPPSNDECNGAINLTVAADNSCSSIYTGDMGWATQSFSPCIATGYDAKDIWFKFSATSSTHRITVTPVSFDDYVFQVYSGNCGTLTSIACVNNGELNDPDVSLLTNLVPGNIYYIRVFDYYGVGSSFRHFSICVNSSTASVNNDDCNGALVVTPSADANPGVNVSAHNIGATSTMAGCYGTAEDDVWFRFTATSSRHRITVLTNALIKPVLQVFAGSCASLNSISCQYTLTSSDYDFVDADLTNLTVGQTYYYRVYGTSASNERTSFVTNIRTLQQVLPVSLTHFQVQKEGLNNTLTWETANEINNKGFVVEFSRSGIHFDSLFFVASKVIAGNSSLPLHYFKKHAVGGLPEGKLYYRIKQLDLNGASRYSNVVFVDIEKPDLALFPNPASNYLFLQTSQANPVLFSIIDVYGRRISNGISRSNKIPISHLQFGVYFLQLQTEAGVNTLKFIKK